MRKEERRPILPILTGKEKAEPFLNQILFPILFITVHLRLKLFRSLKTEPFLHRFYLVALCLGVEKSYLF